VFKVENRPVGIVSLHTVILSMGMHRSIISPLLACNNLIKQIDLNYLPLLVVKA